MQWRCCCVSRYRLPRAVAGNDTAAVALRCYGMTCSPPTGADERWGRLPQQVESELGLGRVWGRSEADSSPSCGPVVPLEPVTPDVSSPIHHPWPA